MSKIVEHVHTIEVEVTPSGGKQIVKMVHVHKVDTPGHIHRTTCDAAAMIVEATERPMEDGDLNVV